MGKKIDEWDASQALAKAIHEERVNGCPHEGWGGLVFDADGQIMDAKVDDDNNVVVVMQFEDPLDTGEQGWFELVLRPVAFRRSIPEAGKRKSRAKDVRAQNRARSRKQK
jgi:hypothetical protein